jgi:hypothetical protein
MEGTMTNGTIAVLPPIAAIPDELEPLHKLSIIQREIITLLEEKERLTFAAQAMKLVGDPQDRRDPQIKELGRVLRLLKAYRAREAELMAVLTSAPAQPESPAA